MTNRSTPNFTASSISQKILSHISDLQYPCPESDLLESLGVDHLRQVLDVVNHRGNGHFEPADRNTPTGMKWFGKFLSAYVSSGRSSDVASTGSLVMLAAVISPLLPKFIPVFEKHSSTVVDLPAMLSDLHDKLLAYWECLPEDSLLYWLPRKNYARGAFLHSLVNTDVALPLTIIDDIHLQWIGAAHKEYSTKSANYLFRSDELTTHFLYANAGTDAQRSYNLQMENDAPLLTFTPPGTNGKLDGHKGDTVTISGTKLDTRSFVALERMMKARGVTDLSKSQFFKLAKKLLGQQQTGRRSLIAMSAEWSDDDNKTILKLLSEISEETYLEAAAEVFLFAASMPRLGNSHHNLMHCLHAARMAPLISTLHNTLESDDGNEIDEAVGNSNPYVSQAEYTPEMDLIARGKVIKYFVENERMNHNPREVSDELLLWLGENADDLSLHIKTLVQHERVDRELFEAIIATSALGSGAL